MAIDKLIREAILNDLRITERDSTIRKTVTLSEESIAWLETKQNQSAVIDWLIQERRNQEKKQKIREYTDRHTVLNRIY